MPIAAYSRQVLVKIYYKSAAVFIDPQTGEILAMSGGREYDTRFGLNRATDMLRQPGSIIKPIVAYYPCFGRGILAELSNQRCTIHLRWLSPEKL